MQIFYKICLLLLIVGAITEKNQAEALQKLIDQALAADKG